MRTRGIVPRTTVRRVVAMAVGFACVACGGSGGGEDVTTRTAAPTITSPPSEIVPYCEATVAFDIVLFDAISVIDDAPPAQLAATAKGYAATLQTLAAKVLAETPEEVAADVQNLAAAIDQMAAAGDVSGFTSDAVETSNARLNTFNSENCGWPLIILVTDGGPLGGVPQQLGPGFHVFRIRNGAARPTQVDLYHETPDAPDQSIASLLPAGTPVTPIGVTSAASSVVQPGQEASLLVDLELGEYGFVLADPAGTLGPVRVFDRGTVRTFRVAEGG